MRSSDWSSDVCSSDLEIAEQVGFATVLVDALHAALENGEHALDGVRVNETANVFPGRVLHRLMPAELAASLDVELAFVGVPRGVARAVADQRSEERSVGNEGGSHCRSRGSPYL